MQRNFIARYLDGSRGGELKDAALVAFVSPGEADWRFSLVKMDYRFEESKTGKIKVKEEFTPARRWSFLVGSNEASHTAQSRIVHILAGDEHNPTLSQLEETFNIETVTREFFEKYRELFIRAKEALDKVVEKDSKVKADFESKGVDTVNFAKKLLGQLVFLYFLQKKGWFGVKRNEKWGSGSKHFLRELFEKKHGDYGNFYDDILETLFYAALRNDRSHDDHYFSQFRCKIPFLNGGLFDPMNDYDWVETDILLPDELFSNKIKTKESDIGTGILDIFDRYNFTVKENEPLEKEVAIDPELLGKAYEKFNAIRPDNYDEYRAALKSGQKGAENKFNKKFGVYYTPREIVHYMCQQSLINYLHTDLNKGTTSYQRIGESQTNAFGNETKTGQLDLTSENRTEPEIGKEDIETLIKSGEQVGENEVTVLVKEKNIAEGKQQTTTLSSNLPESIRQNARRIDDALANITVCDPAVGSGAFPVGMMHEIVKTRNVLSTFVEDRNHTIYSFKRECIEKSLYGVDIDAGAVEIAKLRLWLSLVVDEDDIKNIKPLPNLDYKIVCGNSLLAYPYKPTWTQEVESLKKRFLLATSPKVKQELKNQIDSKLKGFLENSKESLGYRVDFDFEIFFSEVFYEKGGFYVVIANPPYVQIQKLHADAKDQLAKQGYLTFAKTADLYCLFYERGIAVLHSGGVLVFISSNKFFRAGYGAPLRQLLNENNDLLEVIDFGELPVFDAGTDPCIILVVKRQPQTKSITAAIVKDVSGIQNVRLTMEHIAFELDRGSLNSNGWTLEHSSVIKLLEKIRSAGKPLGEYVNGRFYRGFLTGFNEAFVIDRATRDRLIGEDQKSAELIRPWLRGKDIRRWYADDCDLFVINILSSANTQWPWSGRKIDHAKAVFKKEYPAVFNHLKPHKTKLINRDDQGQYYWELRSCAYYEEFERTKIVYNETSKELHALLDGNGLHINKTGFIILSEDAKFLLGIINSRLMDYLYRCEFPSWGDPWQGGRIQFRGDRMGKIPVAMATPKQQMEIETLVDRILELKRKTIEADVTTLEAEIDQMVYQLYGLTKEEMRIVKGEKK